MSLTTAAVETVQQMLSIDVEASVIVLGTDTLQRTFVRRDCSTAAWEAGCVLEVPGSRRAAFAMPMTTASGEAIHIVTVDLDIGLDVLRCAVTRDADGAPAFGPVEKFTGRIQVAPEQPGFVLANTMDACAEAE